VSSARRARHEQWATGGPTLGCHRARSRSTRRLKPQLEPAQIDARIEPLRRVYDLRHTFATFTLRDMGARLTIMDRRYGQAPRPRRREHAIRLLDTLNVSAVDVGGRSVDVANADRRRERQRNRR